MSARLAAFRRKWRGKRCSGHTTGGGQCIDLFREWNETINGSSMYGVPRVVAAKDIFEAADPKKWRKVRHKPGKQGHEFPPDEAVVVFGGGRWGHVAIARSNCTKRRLLTFDQNWSVKQRCTDETHDYSRVIGWLIARPKRIKRRRS